MYCRTRIESKADGQDNGATVKDLDRYETAHSKENEDGFVMQWIRLY